MKKNITIELSTKAQIKIGGKLKCIIETDEYGFEGEEEKAKLLEVQSLEGYRLGYVIKAPKFAEYSFNEILESMERMCLEEIELEVIENKTSLSDSKRNTYVLKVTTDAVINDILGFNVSEKSEELMSKFSKYIEEETKEANTTNEPSVTSFKTNVKGSGGKENPNKTAITKMLKAGNYPEQTELKIVKDEEGKFRVEYLGKLAGELENTPDNFDISTVKSISCVESIPYGYVIEVVTEQGSSIEHIVEEETASTLEVVVEPENDTPSIVGAKANVAEVNKENVVPFKKTPKPVNVIQKAKKADKAELQKILEYLVKNNIPENYIESIIKSHKEYELKYLERIPHSSDKNFTAWEMPKKATMNLLLIAIVAMEQNINVRMVGGKGAGKNTLLNTLSWIYQKPLFSQSTNRDTDITHIYGDQTIDVVEVDGTPIQVVGFKKGLLTEAMEVGGIFELGEGNTCRAEVAISMNPVLDDRREADVNHYKLVKANPDFRFTLTMNVDYEGCRSLNESFRDRFMTIPFPSPDDIAKILEKACKGATKKSIDICNRLYKDLYELVEELQQDDIITIRGYINAVKMHQGGIPLKMALECCVAHNVSDDILIVNQVKQMIDNLI